jgi:4-amino-4-deoxy-L-arabinose transferase-like glycosyltransferase
MPALEVRSRNLLLLILLIALGVRVYMLVTRAAVIENEGAGYGYMAETLLHGTTSQGGPSAPDIVDCWFYPFLIAGVSLVTQNTEIAVRLVALAFGTCLVIPVFYLARRLYGELPAFLAAGFVALHPLLIALSVAGYSEGLQLTLVTSALYWVMRCRDGDAKWAWLWAGIFLGCAYLNRTEALAFPFLAILLLVAFNLWDKGNWRSVAWKSAGLLGVFALFALPYVAFLTVETGSFRFEAKNKLNYTILRRELSGMTYTEASLGIDENLNPTGPLLDQNRYATYSPYPSTVREMLGYFAQNASNNKYWIYNEIISSFALGSFLIFVLAAIGVLNAPWDRDRLFQESLLLGVFLFTMLLLLAVQSRQVRYTFPLLPFLIIWSSNGLAVVYRWANQTARLCGIERPARSVGIIAVTLPALFMLVCAASGTADIDEFKSGRPRHLPQKQAGLWLREYQPGPKRIVAGRTVIPFYAGGYQVLLPYADATLALRYIQKKSPDFIVLDYTALGRCAYVGDWLEHGIPAPQAKLIYQGGNPSVGKIAIYRWLPSPDTTRGGERD